MSNQASYNKTWRHKCPENAVSYQLTNARWRAKKRGLEATIALEDLLPLPTHCPVFGMLLRYDATDPNDPHCWSLDRKDNSLGYTKDNVVIVSLKANKLKRDATPVELRQLADFYAA